MYFEAMKPKALLFPLFFLLTFPLMPAGGHAAVRAASSPLHSSHVIPSGPFAGLKPEAVMDMTYRELQAATGAKMNLFQRLGWKMAQKRFRRSQKEITENISAKKVRASENKFGLIGIILAGAGLLFLFIPYIAILSFFLAVAGVVLGGIGLKRDAKPGLAIGSLIIGGATLLLMIAALVVTASLL